MAETADVIVIGAGIAGIGAAAHLAPHARVVVLETEARPGYHASGRSAAIYLKNYGNRVVRALTRAGEGDFTAPPPEAGEGSLLKPRGILTLAAEDEQEALERHLAESPEAVEISPDEAVARFPILRRDPIARAAIEEDAPDIDVERLMQGWQKLIRRHGGEIATSARVGAVRRRAGAWRVEAGARTLEAPVLVDAAGAWADAVAGLAGVTPLGLRPLRRSAAILPAPEGHDVSGWPLAGSVTETWYAKPDAGRLMVSPANEDPVDPHDAWADDMVLAEGLDRFERATTMELTRLAGSWAGLRTFAPDRTPVAGADPEAPGFFWLAGQGGYGIQTAPAMSRLAAALILGQDPGPELAGLAPALSPARFRNPKNGADA